MYKYILKPILFKLDPEFAHDLVFSAIKIAFKTPILSYFLKKIYSFNSAELKRNFLGLDFKNPIGLAAGFDKNGLLIDEFDSLGFGFVELGTVTPLAQYGNEKKRLFRLPKDEALINRMGFNNEGVKVLATRIRASKSSIIIGGNIGKNKMTTNESAVEDYEKCFLELFDLVHYFVVNVSSPNTPNLRELQDKIPLTNLLQKLNNLNQKVSTRKDVSRKPILLKIAPDLTTSQLDDIIEIVALTKIDGIVATNTTTMRSGLQTTEQELDSIGIGGLSGKPLKLRSTEIIRYIHQKSNGSIFIIGVGGIFDVNDAKEKIAAGASLIQLYSGYIYEGPRLVSKICKGLVN